MALITRFIPEAAHNAPAAQRHAGKVYYEIDTETSEKKVLHRGSFRADLNPKCTVYLTDRLWFGKYNLYNGVRLTVKEIIKEDPEYIGHLMREGIVLFDPTVFQAYNTQMELAR